jgi:DNA-binding transcriptional LysR family regulator
MAGFSRLITSPRALLVFEAAARTGSFTAASTEFNVSQPSISRTISQLEDELGFKLFVRHSRGLALTSEGAELQTAVNEGFSRVTKTLEMLEQRRSLKKSSVTLSVSTSFATQWLIPRLAEFNTAFPTVDLRLKLISALMKDVTGDFDIATRLIDDDETRYHRWDFAPEIILAVCSPQYIEEHGTLDIIRPASRHTFLHLIDHSMDRWQPFIDNRQTRYPDFGTWNHFSDYSVVLQAAAQGKGVALGWVSVVASALNAETLVPASNARLVTGRTHHLIVPKSKSVPAQVFEICDWLTSRMADDISLLKGKFI